MRGFKKRCELLCRICTSEDGDEGKGKVLSVLKYLSTMLLIYIGELKKSSTILDLATSWR
jgi:hypothetical protein